MRVGCGLRVRRIDGNDYLYFWHYEREGGRSERREDYVGPAREARSRQEAARKLLAFHRRGPQELGARIARVAPTTLGHRKENPPDGILPLNRGRTKTRANASLAAPISAGLPFGGPRGP